MLATGPLAITNMSFTYPVSYTPAVEVPPSGDSDGSSGGTREVPSGAINGSNAVFMFTAPPILIYRNGLNETRLGVISGNTFTFDVAPRTDDDIEGLI